MEDGNDRAVFTGDTLFVGGAYSASTPDAAGQQRRATLMPMTGCGKFFEGDAKQMNAALNEVLAKLPDDTKVYVRARRLALLSWLTFLSPATSTPRTTASSLPA